MPCKYKEGDKVKCTMGGRNIRYGEVRCYTANGYYRVLLYANNRTILMPTCRIHFDKMPESEEG